MYNSHKVVVCGYILLEKNTNKKKARVENAYRRAAAVIEAGNLFVVMCMLVRCRPPPPPPHPCQPSPSSLMKPIRTLVCTPQLTRFTPRCWRATRSSITFTTLPTRSASSLEPRLLVAFAFVLNLSQAGMIALPDHYYV